MSKFLTVVVEHQGVDKNYDCLAAVAERVPLAVFAMGHVKRIRLLAMLSGLRLEAELSGLQVSATHKVSPLEVVRGRP